MAPPAHPAAVVTRVLVVLVALLAAGWLAVSLRDTRLQDQGIKLFQQPHVALAKFESAKRLSASTQPAQLQAAAYWALGEHERAIAMLQQLLREEPENRIGWVLLSSWLAPTDPAGARAAALRAQKLNGKIAARTP